MSYPDRIAILKGQTTVTGIDFISVDQLTQMKLSVHFHVAPSTLNLPLQGILVPGNVNSLKKIRIYSPSGSMPDVPLASISWTGEVLQITTSAPGGFAFYKLKIDVQQIDLYYNDVTFSFKANCPSDLDCAPTEHECPPEEPIDIPINYLARDFWSFRRSLLEFASLRYPDWPDRLEADSGVMMVEVMSAVGDEMAYFQDRIAREAFLETATQRRSLRRHCRLVDYQISDGSGAHVWLDVKAKVGAIGLILPGSDVWAENDDGTKIEFEVGKGLKYLKDYPANLYIVKEMGNLLSPYIWDEAQLCLPVNSIQLYVIGWIKALFPFNDQIDGLPNQVPGRWFLLKTNPANPAQPTRTHMVRVTELLETVDPMMNNLNITRLTWESDQALPFEMDMTCLEVHANLIPATTGRTKSAYFIVGADNSLSLVQQTALRLDNGNQDAPRAIERTGPDGSVSYLFSLPSSDETPLVWLGNDAENTSPEIILEEMKYNSGLSTWDVVREWDWKRALLGVNSSQSEDTHFTLDDGTWKRVVGYQRTGEEIVHQDYAGDRGVTIRFGDGEFGEIPSKNAVFRVRYRLGEKRRSNVSKGTLKYMSDMSLVDSVSNPIHASGGFDGENADEMRQLAPEAFRAVTYRAVRPEDYAEAAERLPWVQRAGATFRWTGSWLSAFVTPDPRGIGTLENDKRQDLVHQMDRFRQAGREVNVMAPVYADIDIEIALCIASGAYRGEVSQRVLEVLTGRKGVNPTPGFFSDDNFTFGTPLRLSAIVAVIQAVAGVNAVEGVQFRRRGHFNWRLLGMPPYYPGDNTIIRIDNDFLHPERGIVRIN